MKVLVVGATGKYAGRVVPELKKRGANVRALIRDATSADAARRQGADEMAVGDLNDPASLRAAAEGVDGVFHINPAFAPNESELGVGMVEAARAAGVRKFVFSGVYHPSLSKMTNHAAKRPVEEAIFESGLLVALTYCMSGYLIHSAIDQTRSAKPAAIAGVLGVQSPESSRTRNVRTGQQKLSLNSEKYVAAS